MYRELVTSRNHNPKRANLYNITNKINCIGEMKPMTSRRIKNKLIGYYDSMYDFGDYKRKKHNVFHPIVTLTLPSPQLVDDNTIKRELLSRFIDKAKERYDIKMYYWVAEAQENENLHFHILTDRFIDHKWARSYWNQRCDTLGMIDAFEAKHGHRNPPTEQCKKIESLAASSKYVTKYTTKLDQYRGVQGRLHGMSDMLRGFKLFSDYPTASTFDRLEDWVDHGYLHKTINEEVAVYSGQIRPLLKALRPKFYNEWREWNQQQAKQMYI